MRDDPLDAHPVGPVFLDGGLATELEDRGLDLSDALWSARALIEAPATIREVHVDYFTAGADVATTATYQATFAGFARRGLDRGEAERLMRLAVQLACEAREVADATTPAERPRLVAASIGSYGAFRADGGEYRGDYDIGVDELVDFHRPRLELLLDTPADFLICETVPSRDEAEAVARLLTEYPEARAVIGFSCRDGLHISDGTPLAEVVAALRGHPAVIAAGLNCTAPSHVGSLLSSLPDDAPPRVAFPNAGEGWEDGAWTGRREEPGTWAASAAAWAPRVRLVGGCCRTTPAHIRALIAALS